MHLPDSRDRGLRGLKEVPLCGLLIFLFWKGCSPVNVSVLLPAHDRNQMSIAAFFLHLAMGAEAPLKAFLGQDALQRGG